MKLYVFLMSFINSVLCYKPILLIHGVLSEASHLEDLKDLIEGAHPGTNVTMIKLYPEVESFVPLMRQLEYWKEKISSLMEAADEGVHLICHSQGGLICQGVAESYDNHNIKTFIALSSPLNGQFGVPAYVTNYVPWLKGSRESLSKLMYTTFAQDTFAISNYWKDPRARYRAEYASNARYLPWLQNHPNASHFNEKDAMRRKQNFLKLKKLVLIGGPDDGVITPWQSSIFGEYDDRYNVLPMKDNQIFTDDWFGLRTLFTRGDVMSYNFSGIKHVHWHGNKKVFREAMEQWLD